MAVVRVLKHSLLRERLKILLSSLKDDRIINSVFKTDKELINDSMLPSVCIFVDEGRSFPEVLDESQPNVTEADLIIKVKASVQEHLEGDDYLDEIADAVSVKLNSDLTLGGLLKDEIYTEDFEYLRDQNQTYTTIVFRSTIHFHDN